MAILGPGLIVMAGDNDAGAFATYGQAGQNYGTTLLWTMLLLIPVFYVNQEMVLRLGAVTGVGHSPTHFRAVSQVLGRVQRHRPFPSQRFDHHHRVHRHLAGARLSWAGQDHGRDRLGCAHHDRRQHRELPALRAIPEQSCWSLPACCSSRSISRSGGRPPLRSDEPDLDLDRATHGVYHTSEFSMRSAVAGALDDAAMMHSDRRIDQVAAQRPQPRERPVLVGAGEPAVADDVRDQDRRNLARLRSILLADPPCAGPPKAAVHSPNGFAAI